MMALNKTQKPIITISMGKNFKLDLKCPLEFDKLLRSSRIFCGRPVKE